MTITKGLAVSNHAHKRAVERFGVKDPQNWVRQKMEHAKYMDEVIDEKGKPGRLFACNGVNLDLALDNPVVTTVMIPQACRKSKRSIERLARKEIDKAEKDEVRAIRRAEVLRGEIEMELGELRIKLARSRSFPKQLSYKGRIKALEMRLADLPEEQTEAKRQKTRIVRGFAAFV